MTVATLGIEYAGRVNSPDFDLDAIYGPRGLLGPLADRYLITIEVPTTYRDVDPLLLDDVAEAFRQRDVIGSFIAGDRVGFPDRVIVMVVVDSNGHVLIDGGAGRVRPDQHISEFGPGMAYRLGRPLFVDDEIIAAGNSSSESPTDKAGAFEGSMRGRSWLWWRDTDTARATALMIATAAGQPLNIVRPGGVVFATYAADAITTDTELPEYDRADRPAGVVVSMGESFLVELSSKRMKTPFSVFVEPPHEPLATYPAGSECAAVSAACLVAQRLPAAEARGIEIDEAAFDAIAAVQAASPLPPVPRRFAEICDALGVPAVLRDAALSGETDLAALVARGQSLGQFDTDVLPDTVVDRIEPLAQNGPVFRAAARTAFEEVFSEAPRGAGWYARMRRWLWGSRTRMVVFGVIELAIAVALGAGVAGAFGEPLTLWGQGWLLWLIVGMWALDGLICVATARAIPRRR